MDEERKDLELEEDEELDDDPYFEELNPDAAPLDEPYHQISFPEEAEIAQEEILEETPGDYAAAQQQAEEDREVEEILEKRTAENPIPKNDGWKTIHSEFAAEVERFAHEAEDFAKKVNEYINDPDMNFGLDKEEEKPEEAPVEEKKRDAVEYIDVEPEVVDIPSQEETIIPEPLPKPAEPRRRTKRRKPERPFRKKSAPAAPEAAALVDASAPKAEVVEPTEPTEPAEAAETVEAAAPAAPAEPVEKPVKRIFHFDKSKWRRTPYAPVINATAVPAEFNIPLGTQEEWLAGEAQEPVVATREKPKYSFNDDPTRELSPVEELPAGGDTITAPEVVPIPHVETVDLSKKEEIKPDGIAGDTGYLPDLSKLDEAPAAQEWLEPEEPEVPEEPEIPEEPEVPEDLEFPGEPEDLDKTLDKFLVSEEPDEPEPEDVEEEDTLDETADEEPDEPKGNFWDTIKTTVITALEGGESDGEFTDTPSADEPAEIDEEPALADKTTALPIHNARIDHQFHERTDEEPSDVEENGDDEIAEAYNSFKTAVLKDVDEYLNEGESPEEGGEPVRKKTKEIDPSKAETLDLAEAAAQEQEQEQKKEPRKSNFIHTYELEKAPKIVPEGAKFNSLDRTILASGKDQPVVHADPEQIDGQIKLDGFDDVEPTPVQLDDKHVEAELRAKRTQQVKDFKIVKDNETTDGEDQGSSLDEMPTFGHGTRVTEFIKDEYHGPEDRRTINRSLSGATRSALISTIAQAVLTVAALVLGIIVSLAHGNLEAIGGSTVTCGVIGILLLVASAGFGWKVLVKGFAGLFKGQINAASGYSVLYVICLIEDIVLMFAETDSQAASLYTAAACFSMTMSCLSRYLSLKRVMDNFKFMNSGTALHSTRVITSKDDASAIGRGLLLDEPTIAYHAPSDIPSGFIEDSFADDPADEYSKRPFFIVIAVAAVVALIAGIIGRSAATGVNVLTCILALGIPAFSILAYNFGLYYEDKFFSRKNAVILGHRAVEKSAYIDTFAIDSSEIFGKGSCSILGIKTFHDMKIDDAILYAAALVIRSGGPLAEVFEKTILGKRNLLPEVEDLQYEERLGLSAWTHDRRILFGNRQFLINHNVQVPNTEYEGEYTRNGHKVCYLAISGKIAAMFVIRYRASRRTRKCLRQMDRAGIVLLVSNTDCNITEEMIARKFRVSTAAVKVISPVAGDLLKQYQSGDDNTESEDVGILHTGSPEASMKSLYEARRLYDGVSINNVFVLTYAAIAIILGIIFTFASTAGMISDPFVVLTQLIGTGIAVGIAWMRGHQGVKNGRKRK